MSDNPEALLADLRQWREHLMSATVPVELPHRPIRVVLDEAIAALAQQAATPAPAEPTERDAARYRWLRDASEWEPFSSSWLCSANLYGQFGEDMDAYIDAAMGAAPPATPAAQPADERLVPVEPNEAMAYAGACQLIDGSPAGESYAQEAMRVWRAMARAALEGQG